MEEKDQSKKYRDREEDKVTERKNKSERRENIEKALKSFLGS